jgi:uncharacterized protein (TIGR02594 family)
MTTLELQMCLKALGYGLGTSGPNKDGVDGSFGRLTRAAVAKFQADRGLAIQWPGTVGPTTIRALNAALVDSPSIVTPAAPITVTPPWLEEARRWKGLTENVGKGSNATILRWGKAIADWFVDDDTPWCGAFVHGQLAAALPDEVLPSNALWARAWGEFGVPLKNPAPGAVLVFSRGTGGHVGFYVGEDDTRFRVLGGNQSNAVTDTWIAKSRLIATRWPKTFPLPTAGRVLSTAGGALSTNEA